MKAEDSDKKFDQGKEDIIGKLGLFTTRRVNQAQERLKAESAMVGDAEVA